MPVRRLIIMPSSPGRGSDLVRALENHGLNVRNQAGCQQFEAFQSAHDPDRICLLMLWRDEAALEEHLSKPIPDSVTSLRRGTSTDEELGTLEDYEYNRKR